MADIGKSVRNVDSQPINHVEKAKVSARWMNLWLTLAKVSARWTHSLSIRLLLGSG